MIRSFHLGFCVAAFDFLHLEGLFEKISKTY